MTCEDTSAPKDQPNNAASSTPPTAPTHRRLLLLLGLHILFCCCACASSVAIKVILSQTPPESFAGNATLLAPSSLPSTYSPPASLACILLFGITLFLITAIPSPAALKTTFLASTSSWQLGYMTALSLGRLAFATVCGISSGGEFGGSTSAICLDIGFVASQMVHYVIFLTSAAIDNNPDASPFIRRSTYLTLAALTVVDAITSSVLAPVDVTFVMIGRVRAQPFQDIASATATQAVVAIYLTTLSWRSAMGKAWGHHSVRFVLSLQLSESRGIGNVSVNEEQEISLHVTGSGNKTASTQGGSLTSRGSLALKRGLGFAARLRRSFFLFQQRYRDRCVAIVIPCNIISADDQGKAIEFELQRPLFELRFMRKIQLLALAHTFKYSCTLVGSLAVSLAVFALGDNPLTLRQDAICTSLNAFAVFLAVGFSSGNGRFCYEATCSRLIMKSFRFCYTMVLQVVWISTLIRRAALNNCSPLQPAAIFFCAILSLMFLLNDGVPALPTSVQTVQSLFGFMVFGWFALGVFLKISDPTQDLECWGRVGSLELCTSTVQFSVFTNLALVYGFMLIVRLMVPGVSMFLNGGST